MIDVLNCMVNEHDHGMLAVAVIICVMGVFSSFRLYARSRISSGKDRMGWVILTGLAGGAGIWATHFTAMMAYKTSVPIGYDLTLTLISLALVIGGNIFSAYIGPRANTLVTEAFLGVFIGTCIILMHHIGMAAMVIPGYLYWDVGRVILADGLGLTLSAVSIVFAGANGRFSRPVFAPLFMILAVVSIHFGSMSAVSLVPSVDYVMRNSLTGNLALGGLIAGVTFMILTLAVIVVFIEAKFAQQSRSRMLRLANGSFEGLMIVSSGRIAETNQALIDLTQCADTDLVGYPIASLLLDSETSQPLTQLKDGVSRAQILIAGQRVPVEVLKRALDVDKDEYVCAVRDLRERLAAEAEIQRLSERDHLTGLLNRKAFTLGVEDLMEEAHHADQQMAMIKLEVSQLNELNSLHGPQIGDTVLLTLSQRLRGVIHAPHQLARVSGSKFAIYLTDPNQPQSAIQLVELLAQQLSEPIDLGDLVYTPKLTFGAAVYPGDGRTPNALLAACQTALSIASENGETQQFFRPELEQKARRRRKILDGLDAAILNGRLTLNYQPLARVSDGRLIGFEALCRWTDPEMGVVPPDIFIPIAEESGLIHRLGDWVIQKAILDAKAWPDTVTVAINVSPVQAADPDLSSKIREALVTHDLSPRRLEIEVTETALIGGDQTVLDNLRRLKAMGLKIAIDDFGTGYSSLSTLQAFPFDKIKIDKSFMNNIGTSERSDVIVRSIVGLGKSLNVPVLAEGVETLEHVRFLRREGAAMMQGWCIGKPHPSPYWSELVLQSGPVVPELDPTRSMDCQPLDQGQLKAAPQKRPA
ncbi:MAG: EAL domain-containing protein [Asticcacaulis sp.]